MKPSADENCSKLSLQMKIIEEFVKTRKTEPKHKASEIKQKSVDQQFNEFDDEKLELYFIVSRII